MTDGGVTFYRGGEGVPTFTPAKMDISSRTYTCRIHGNAFGVDAVAMGDLDGSGREHILIT
jgi:hypothetical protein